MTISPIANRTDLETSTWEWQGHRIEYIDVGRGCPLLLVHGFGASLGHWRKNIPAIAEAGYRVFALDLLGFGGSDKPARDYTVELWQQQLYDFWEARIGEPTVVVGNSIGGLLALMAIADRPEIAAGGVLLNCAGGLNHRPEELPIPLRWILGGFTKAVTSPVGSLLFNVVRQKSRIRSTLKQVYCDRAAVTDELVELIYRPACDPGAGKVFASVLSAPPGPKPTDLLPRVESPLLVLWGERDPWTPIAGAACYRQLAGDRADVEFQSIPNAGHCPHDERPELVNEAILAWLGRTFD